MEFLKQQRDRLMAKKKEEREAVHTACRCPTESTVTRCGVVERIVPTRTLSSALS